MDLIQAEIQPQDKTINWRAYPAIENFQRAQSYLELLTSLDKASEIVDRLQEDYELRYHGPGDILRAAGLFAPMLSNGECNKVIRDINSKLYLNPPLLVIDPKNTKLHIAHGYEVVAAVHFYDSGAKVPCHITAWDSPDSQ